MTNSEVDVAILSVVGESWMKVAKAIVEVAQMMGGGIESHGQFYEVIGQRIECLVRDGRLAAQGNVKSWRFSEVRRSHADQETTSK